MIMMRLAVIAYDFWFISFFLSSSTHLLPVRVVRQTGSTFRLIRNRKQSTVETDVITWRLSWKRAGFWPTSKMRTVDSVVYD